MPQSTLGPWSVLLDLALGAAAGLAGGFVRWNNPERRRLDWCLVWEVPSAALHDLAVAILRHRAGLPPNSVSGPRLLLR